MQATVTVECRALGRKAPLFSDWSIPLAELVPVPGEAITLGGLISQIVRDEVDAFKVRQEERRLTRVLTAGEIEQGRAGGKVDMGGHGAPQPVDIEGSIVAALQAFEDRLYLVFVDGRRLNELGAELNLVAGSRISFLRLVALAGG